ncbi:MULTISPECIES: N-acetylglucosamine kinase [unclassified Nocardia]|uniref:N-acetylglucosamine kinase n=1 Tax=unclassified Nocardia TaxID=2637762 RepID=UPI001CE45AE9|nr:MULTISPECIES: BadF/BadG/BcrA/BcrD ATPase family protein [unclassified Nocardia]
MAGRVLAVDLGKTSCRGSMRVDGVQVGFAEVAGTPGLASAGGVAMAEKAIRAVLAGIGPQELPLAVCVGAAGAVAAPEAAVRLAEGLASLPEVGRVAVTSDAVTAHAGALGGGPGVVLAAGTGTVATAVDEMGRFTRVDGWGPLLGDVGSGGWIGAEGLRAVLRAHDGRGAATVLLAEVAELYGIAPDELPKFLGQQENPTLVAARFAPVVARAAASDEVAAEIMSAAGAALGRSVCAAIERSGLPSPVPFAITGGLVNLGGPLLDPLDAAITYPVDRRVPAGGPIDGAALLAADRSTVLEPLIARIDTQPL